MKLQLLKPFLIIILLLVSSVSYAQFINGLNHRLNLHGKVQSCVTTQYNHLRYDTSARYKVSFDSLIFNSKGQEIKGFTTSAVRGADTNKKYCFIPKYDKAGNLTEVLSYDENGNAEFKNAYSYSANKKLVTLKGYFLDGKHSYTNSESYKINGSGRILEKYHPNESFVPDVKCQYGKTVYKYNAKGLRVKEIEYDLNGLEISKRFLKYNQNNEMSESNFIWLKDQRGNEYITFTYIKYDKHHNWLVKNMFLNGKFHSVTERQITYYK